MRKPVSILALDEAAAALAEAARTRVARACGLDDLVQSRTVLQESDLAPAIQSIHAQRQRPDSPLRTRDDISTRELVLLIASATGTTIVDTATQIRRLYETKRLAAFFTIEILLLLPEATGSSDYASAYGLLKALSAAEPKPFDEVWLVDAMNAHRVRFEPHSDAFADALAGVLMFEPEMSGALPGLHPRGMHPTFSSFGYAELVFPREIALQRLEPRFAAELLRSVILRCADAEGSPASLRAKQFVVHDSFATPLSRIGIETNQSLFKRFQAKTLVTERTRSAEESIAAVRNELKIHRDTTHLGNLETLARQGEQTASDFAALLDRTIDETLDRDGYPSAIELLDALLDPLPDLRAGTDVAPRNLVTEINAATAALDERVRFTPNSAASAAARKRVRELDHLLQDQKLVADTLVTGEGSRRADAALAAMEQEKSSLLRQLPEMIFSEEAENNAARNAARDAEAARLAEETHAREQRLRELFAQKPRAEQTLAEALEARRTWLWQQVVIAAVVIGALYFAPFVFAITGLAAFAIFTTFRYLTVIVPRVREAREALARLCEQIDVADAAKNVAHNDELQFEYDIAHRRTTLNVLRRTRETAKQAFDALRARHVELEQLAASFALPSIASTTLSISVVDDEDVDAWYDHTVEDRKPFLRDFPLSRSESRVLPLEELRERILRYATTAFESFRAITLAQATASLVSESKLTQRLRRFTDCTAPLIELRDDDLPAQQAMQRDTTLFMDTADAVWVAQVRRRLPDAYAKPSADPLRIHAVSRVLHYPGYLLGQVDYYRAQYEAAAPRNFDDVPDLVPLTAAVRDAYEQVLLARAVGVIELRDGNLVAGDVILGNTHLAAAQHLAANDASSMRERLSPKLEIARDVERDLRELLAADLSTFDRTVVGTLIQRYAS